MAINTPISWCSKTKTEQQMTTKPPTSRPAPRRKSDLTRAAIVTAAEALFAAKGYEATSVRDIAAAAEVNAGLIHTYFGSKQRLFEIVVARLLSPEGLLQGDLETLGHRLARYTVKETDAEQRMRGLQLLIRCAASPIASRTVHRIFSDDIVRPLSERLKGPHAAERAALVSAFLCGFGLLQRIVRLDEICNGDQDTLIAYLAGATQNCVDGAEEAPSSAPPLTDEIATN